MPRTEKGLEKRRAYWRKRSKERNARGWRTPKLVENINYISTLRETTPCKDCGNKFPAVCMDFDHVTGTKVEQVSQMVAGRWTRQQLEDEIAKCEIVCANCHRIRTALRKGKHMAKRILGEA